ncbi:DGAT1/2-independent enzyme synthesizing storage lipids [Cloeon dipterum]|uniref:DGAT1/2-independent enzyme synthesizing storage lipids n=1 Tax=Cloeon dipterum TaxID=197152 RepID=UPI0032203242
MLEGLEIIKNATLYVEEIIVQYIDLDFYLWLWWLLTPLVITFLLPMTIGVLFYITSLILYIYKLHRQRLRAAYERDFWDGARYTIAAIWDAHGWLWHGYEIEGLDNLPVDSPALIVYYHGAIPIDIYYFVAKTLILKNRLIHTVADNFLFNIPGWPIIAEALKVIPGTVQTCTSILRENNMLAIAPGGVYEAQFGDAFYHVLWRKRLGFAKVALDAKVPIIPIFTQNLREAFRSVSWGRKYWLKIYQWCKLPIVPIYGGFPVKLKTVVGKPIEYDQTLSPEELRNKVASAIEDLIKKHQQVPGSILRALIQRFWNFDNRAKNE